MRYSERERIARVYPAGQAQAILAAATRENAAYGTGCAVASRLMGRLTGHPDREVIGEELRTLIEAAREEIRAGHDREALMERR